jgi:hypothetical protein
MFWPYSVATSFTLTLCAALHEAHGIPPVGDVLADLKFDWASISFYDSPTRWYLDRRPWLREEKQCSCDIVQHDSGLVLFLLTVHCLAFDLA